MTLQLGSKGRAVIELQAMLNRMGYRDDTGRSLAEDGDYGPRTLAGVLWFQGAHGLTCDGAAGPVTLAHLQATLVEPPSVSVPTGPAPETAPPSASRAAHALDRAREYHRWGVRENPWGDNRGGPQAGAPAWASVNAIEAPWFPNAGQPWCAMFVGQCYRHAGQLELPNWLPLVSNWAPWATERGLFRASTSPYVPQPGDLFCTGASHIGMVEAYDAQRGQIVTVEGNSGNRVASLRRARSGSITHYIALSRV